MYERKRNVVEKSGVRQRPRTQALIKCGKVLKMCGERKIQILRNGRDF